MPGQQIGLGLFTPLCVHGFWKRIGPVAGCGLTTRRFVSDERLDYIASSWDLVNERAYWASGESYEILQYDERTSCRPKALIDSFACRIFSYALEEMKTMPCHAV